MTTSIQNVISNFDTWTPDDVLSFILELVRELPSEKVMELLEHLDAY